MIDLYHLMLNSETGFERFTFEKQPLRIYSIQTVAAAMIRKVYTDLIQGIHHQMMSFIYLRWTSHNNFDRCLSYPAPLKTPLPYIQVILGTSITENTQMSPDAPIDLGMRDRSPVLVLTARTSQRDGGGCVRRFEIPRLPYTAVR